MLQLKIQLILASIIVFIGTLYYVYSKGFKERNFGLIITSYSQGIILSFLFPKYLLIAPIFALAHYLIFYHFWSIKFIFKSRKSEPYTDEDLIQSMRKIPEINHFKFKLRKYSGDNSLNANVLPPIPPFSSEYKISFGDELISILSIKEKINILAHEIGHGLKKHFLIKGIMQWSFIFILGLVSIGFNLIVLNYYRDYFVYLDYTITLILLLSGIIGINIISWHFEYDADKIAIQLTKDITNFESAFLKLDNEKYHNKDYGKIINLLVYSHPLLLERIKRAKEIYEGL